MLDALALVAWITGGRLRGRRWFRRLVLRRAARCANTGEPLPPNTIP